MIQAGMTYLIKALGISVIPLRDCETGLRRTIHQIVIKHTLLLQNLAVLIWQTSSSGCFVYCRQVDYSLDSR